MPKVNDEYFQKKRESILDAAERLCETKPLYRLTMKDIIKETGISPGAMYSSFSDIYEVIVALINRKSADENVAANTAQILNKPTKPEEKIAELWGYLVNLAFNSSRSSNKLLFELTSMFTENEYKEKFHEKLRDIAMYNHVANAIMKVVQENVANGYFVPRVSAESVYALGMFIVDGFIRDLILVKNYHAEIPYGVRFDEKDLAKTFAEATIYLLGRNT